MCFFLNRLLEIYVLIIEEKDVILRLEKIK